MTSKYRVVRVDLFETHQFQVQKKGWVFWHSVGMFYDTYQGAREEMSRRIRNES